MNDVFLGIIAVSVLVIAAVQVTVVMIALRATQRLGALMAQFDRDVRPVVAHMQAIAADAARATSVATAQVERADKLFAELAARVDRTLAKIESSMLGASRGTSAAAWLAGLRAALAVLRDFRRAPGSRPSAVEEEDALFIG